MFYRQNGLLGRQKRTACRGLGFAAWLVQESTVNRKL